MSISQTPNTSSEQEAPPSQAVPSTNISAQLFLAFNFR